MIKAEVDNKQLSLLLGEIHRRGKKPPYKRIMVIGYRSVLRNFQDRGRPERWKALSPLTIMNRKHGGHVPLQDSGALKKSVRTAMRGKDNIAVYTRHRVAQWQQEGTSPYTITAQPPKPLRFRTPEGWRSTYEVNHPGIPARPFMLWQKKDIDDITKILQDHLAGTK